MCQCQVGLTDVQDKYARLRLLPGHRACGTCSLEGTDPSRAEHKARMPLMLLLQLGDAKYG